MGTEKERAVKRPVAEENKEFAELMETVATLEPKHQERVTYFVQGYVAAATTNRATA